MGPQNARAFAIIIDRCRADCEMPPFLDMAIWSWLYWGTMKRIAAGKFKDVCLKMLDEVATTRTPVVITKRGKPVAKLVTACRRRCAARWRAASSRRGAIPSGPARRGMQTLLDAHAWVWWVTENRRPSLS